MLHISSLSIVLSKTFLLGVTKVQPITISPEEETVSPVSGSSSRVSSARSLVSSMWAGSEEPDYDAFAKARRVNLYGQVRRI